jgi:hypothetical protein
MEFKQKKSKCASEGCKKKLNSIDCISNKCKCEMIFCLDHKGPSDHACTFNFIAHSSVHLAKINPKIVAPKLVDEA